MAADTWAPRISVAMIAKDESVHLPECLACLKDLADEICLVDTGSVDATRDIARDFGCKMGYFEWCGDFSAARNASLELCTGDWVFVVDPDERIAPEDVPRIRALAGQEKDCSYRFVTRNYTNNANVGEFVACGAGDFHAQGFAGWYPSGKVRLFPNGLGGCFVGRVHELVNQSLMKRGIEIQTADVPIHHYPLRKSGEELRRKQLMYLEMGHVKTEEYPADPRAWGELGTQYAELGDYHNAAASYREALRLEPANAEWLRSLGGVLQLIGRKDEALSFLKMAVKLDGNSVDAWRNLGVVQADRQAWTEAAACFERAAALTPQNSEIHRYRSVALENGGDLERAAAASKEALRCAPGNAAARALFANQMKALGREGEASSLLEGGG